MVLRFVPSTVQYETLVNNYNTLSSVFIRLAEERRCQSMRTERGILIALEMLTKISLEAMT